MITVKNINGTSNNNCNCGSWINHWTRYSNSPLVFCSQLKCTSMRLLVGAQVQKVGDDGWYIIPLCRQHNAEYEELDVCDNTEFVSANVGETCG